MEIENVATELSTAMKTGNGKSVKETASKLQALHQKKMKEWAYNAPWNELIRGAVDTDLQCNICFEIFIKVPTTFIIIIITIYQQLFNKFYNNT